jgi:universal stress protein A
MIALRQILVASDFSPTADAALDYGRALAGRFGATVHLLHVADNLFFRPTIADPHEIKTATTRRLQSRLTDEDRVRLHARTIVEISDDPADAIVCYARVTAVDLIVMGTHGREGIPHLLMGSVAERVVRTAPCPVLTIRHPKPEFVHADAGRASVEARLP